MSTIEGDPAPVDAPLGEPAAEGRRRRPSGEPPPLPRDIGRSGRFLLFMVVYFAAVLIGTLAFSPLQRLFERFDAGRTDLFVDIRTGWLTDVALAVNILASPWTIRILRWSTILSLIAFKRWRHLVVFVGAILTTEVIAYQTSLFMARPRPLGVESLAPWNGYSMPSQPLAGLAVTLMGITYSILAHGQARNLAKWFIGGTLLAVVLARIYLGVDQMTSAGFGAVFGVAVGLCAFRWFTPNDVFPVTYKRGKAAHLDVGGRRGQAIVTRRERPARPARPRGQARGARGIGRFDAPSPAGCGKRRPARAASVREAVREEPRARRPLVQARADHALRRPRGRDAVQDGPAVRRVRGLHAAAAGRRRAARSPALRHRRDHARARVPDRDGVLRRRRRDRRGRGRRARDRRGPAADPADVGRRPGPPRHQAREPDGAGRASCG